MSSSDTGDCPSSVGDDFLIGNNSNTSPPPSALLASSTTLAGRIWPLFRNLMESFHPEELQRLTRRLYHVFFIQDLLAILILGWGLVPFWTLMYRVLYSRQTSETTIKPFRQTRLYVVIYHFAQAIQLSLLVYLVDLCLVVCCMDEFDVFLTNDDAATTDNNTTTTARCTVEDDTVEFDSDGNPVPTVPPSSSSTPDYSWLFAKILYTVWLAKVAARFKHFCLVQYLGQKKKKDGLALLIDHLLNAMIGGIAAMVIIDILELSGLGIRSAFALGSAGTLALTLGTQTLVQHMVSGFTMTTSNRFYVGDFVKFGHGSGTTFTGTVLSLGWLETQIRGSDELIHTVPNAKLEGIAVSNLSRNDRCQVKQTLRFHYEDVHKLPALLKTMKNNIIEATTPHIVTDGSRPCRVVWSDYTERFLEVMVDVHFEGIKPIGPKFWDNKQKVLMAIQKSVDQHDMKMAVWKCGGCCCNNCGK
ncbi:mechanosensitive ion channel [Nitzschia inconspicua]|uniref:Mechanosensitive ion channel n=1 Tax=Nitzschia inconspicua TaxID=303405 RepID=A0A9K3LKT9_9STRA|nr:mechanosensitive ion channel [Nitzschia inconspicua]